MSKSQNNLSKLSKILSEYLNENDLEDNEDVTLIISKPLNDLKNKSKVNNTNNTNNTTNTTTNKKSNSSNTSNKKQTSNSNNDSDILKNFLIENPEILINLMKEKAITPQKLAKILGKSSSKKSIVDETLSNDNENDDIEGFSSNINDKIKLMMTNYLHKNTNTDNVDKKEGLKLVNLCNKINDIDDTIKILKKKIQDKCLHGDDIWGFIMNKKNDHVGIIKTNGKIERLYKNKPKKNKSNVSTSNISTSNTPKSNTPSTESTNQSIFSRIFGTSSTPSTSSTDHVILTKKSPKPVNSSDSLKMKLLNTDSDSEEDENEHDEDEHVEDEKDEKIFLRKPKNTSIFDSIVQKNSESITGDNIVGQVLDKHDKVFGLILENDNTKYFVAVKNFEKLNLPVYGIKEN